jgi:DNA-binding CsgD family transcriptional regulator
MPSIDLYPNPLPPPRPPATRESMLADVQTGFAALTADELKVARLWLVGEGLEDICCTLRMREKAVQALWHRMRRKLREAVLAGTVPTAEAPAPSGPDQTPAAETTPQAEGGAS